MKSTCRNCVQPTLRPKSSSPRHPKSKTDWRNPLSRLERWPNRTNRKLKSTRKCSKTSRSSTRPTWPRRERARPVFSETKVTCSPSSTSSDSDALVVCAVESLEEHHHLSTRRRPMTMTRTRTMCLADQAQAPRNDQASTSMIMLTRHHNSTSPTLIPRILPHRNMANDLHHAHRSVTSLSTRWMNFENHSKRPNKRLNRSNQRLQRAIDPRRTSSASCRLPTVNGRMITARCDPLEADEVVDEVSWLVSAESWASNAPHLVSALQVTRASTRAVLEHPTYSELPVTRPLHQWAVLENYPDPALPMTSLDPTS